MDSGLDNENPPELGGEEVFFQDDENVVEEQILDGEIEDGEAPEDPEDEIKLEHPPIKQEPPIQSVFKNQVLINPFRNERHDSQNLCLYHFWESHNWLKCAI